MGNGSGRIAYDFSDMSRRILRYFPINNVLQCKNIFTCLFSVHNKISLSRHEQVRLTRLRFKRYFSHHRAIFQIDG